MFVFYQSDGKIIGGCAANSPNVVLTRIPDSTTALYLDDTANSAVWSNMGEYVITGGVAVYTPIPDSIKLANAQLAKIQELQTFYSNTLSAGFVSSASATPLTYGFEDADQTNLSQELNIVNAGLETFPITWVLKGGALTISLTQAQFLQVCKDSKDFKWIQVNKLRNLIGQVQTATTVDAVNLIVW